MRSMSILLLGCLVIAVIVPSVSAAVTKPAVKEVSGALVCQCGCGGKVVATCGCGEAEKIEADIARRLEQGKTKEQILAAYVAQYGEQVLAAPTKTGFNLTAWLMPIAAVLIGGFIVRTTVVRWRKTRRDVESLQQDVPASSASSGLDAAHRDRIMRELKELE